MAESAIDYYKVLSIASDASADDVKSSYRKLSLRYHPDRGGSAHMMAKLNEAYRVLSNPHLRRKHDDVLERASDFVKMRAESVVYNKTTVATDTARHVNDSEVKWSWAWAFVLLMLVIGGAQLYASSHTFEKGMAESSIVEVVSKD